jgi:hypothetical protein
VAALFAYLPPDLEGFVVLLGIALGIWQGILLWQAEPEETPAPEKITSQMNQL